MAFNRFQTVRRFLALSRKWMGLGARSGEPTTAAGAGRGSGATPASPRNHASNLWLECDHDLRFPWIRVYRQIGGREVKVEQFVCQKCGIPVERHLSPEQNQGDRA